MIFIGRTCPSDAIFISFYLLYITGGDQYHIEHGRQHRFLFTRNYQWSLGHGIEDHTTVEAPSQEAYRFVRVGKFHFHDETFDLRIQWFSVGGLELMLD